MNKFIFLSEEFYKDYPADKYPEIEQKNNRPYIYIATKINDTQFAVPLRSNINHNNVLWTNKEDHCGVDFSKAVVIGRAGYVDSNRKPYIRPDEFQALKGKEFIISRKMKAYILKYQKAKRNLQIRYNKDICAYSTLRYFEEYLPKG